jgi:16S rRNA (cytosine1402-N4)-methyltransferase
LEDTSRVFKSGAASFFSADDAWGLFEIANMHRSVMLEEVLVWLQPKAGGLYLDGTIGAGGHSQAILEANGPGGRIIGLDRDAAAVDVARQVLLPFGERAVIMQAHYRDAAQIVRDATTRGVDGAMLDLGISSMQVDRAARGFSFMAEGPLDMRMDQREALTAADLVNRLSEKELARILFEYGEERYARRIARAIIRRRAKGPIMTTLEMVDVIRGTVPPVYAHGRLHCATRTFQALRIVVNRELEDLGPSLQKIAGLLRPGGRFVVLAFHSLEDRIVKQTFRGLAHGANADFVILTKRPVTPSDQECAENPRARSAKLRVLARREEAA